MKITKRQLKRIIKEEKAKLMEAVPYRTRSDLDDWEDRVMLRDVDNAQPYSTRVTVGNDMVTIEFSNSFTIHLDSADAQALASVIREAGLQLEDVTAGRNPGGSIG